MFLGRMMGKSLSLLKVAGSADEQGCEGQSTGEATKRGGADDFVLKGRRGSVDGGLLAMFFSIFPPPIHMRLSLD
jgi:hypothetical protein